jgi:hypothetical protein
MLKLRNRCALAAASFLLGGGMTAAQTVGVSAAGPAAFVFAAQTNQLTPVLFVGGTGSFTVSSFVCVGATVSPAPAAGVCFHSATGVYTNIVCGTLSVDGNAVVVFPGGSQAAATIHIQFVAGIGVLTTSGGVTAAGVLVAVVSSPGSFPVCANSFDVVGAVAIVA